MQEARSGGLSALVSAETVHNILLEERPDLLERLYRPYFWDRRAELREAESPALEAPVFRWTGRLQVRHFPFYIYRAPEVTGVELGAVHRESLEYLDEVMRREGLAVMFALEKGDMQLIRQPARAARPDRL
jgi:hypothetical protein